MVPIKEQYKDTTASFEDICLCNIIILELSECEEIAYCIEYSYSNRYSNNGIGNSSYLK